VAEGRKLPEAKVREIAEGRIYTGRRAKELKLVDDLGGFDDALQAAWALAGQAGEPRVQYPPKEHELSLRDLVRGAFQGAFQGAAEGVRAAPGEGGVMLLAPALVR
jgi:protease-4